MKRLGFTILELIMVMIVIGIMAAVVSPRMIRDHRQEAADTILSAIRYTQYLALNDDKTNPGNANWQKHLWHIRFAKGDTAGKKWFFTISSNMDGDANVDKDETAIDPSNGKYYYNLAGSYAIDTDESPHIFLTNRFDIDSVDFSNCTPLTGSSGTNDKHHVAFDHLGRPHKGIYGANHDYATLMHGTCEIAFGFDDGSIDDIVIHIEPHTGYAWIVDQNAS